MPIGETSRLPICLVFIIPPFREYVREFAERSPHGSLTRIMNQPMPSSAFTAKSHFPGIVGRFSSVLIPSWRLADHRIGSGSAPSVPYKVPSRSMPHVCSRIRVGLDASNGWRLRVYRYCHGWVVNGESMPSRRGGIVYRTFYPKHALATELSAQ